MWSIYCVHFFLFWSLLVPKQADMSFYVCLLRGVHMHALIYYHLKAESPIEKSFYRYLKDIFPFVLHLLHLSRKTERDCWPRQEALYQTDNIIYRIMETGLKLTWTGRRCRRTRLRCWTPVIRWLWRWRCCRSSGGRELSLAKVPEEDPDPDLSSSLGCGEDPKWLHRTEEDTQKCIWYLNSDRATHTFNLDYWASIIFSSCTGCQLTWTGVVVDFIGRDSYLCSLSFSLHDS